MQQRPLLTFIFTLFFAALLPAALACEVSARGPASCSAFGCHKGPDLIECSTSAALDSVPLPKGGDDGSKLDHPHAVALPLSAWKPSRLAHSVARSRIVPVAPERSTLFGQAVLLLI
jgi:hypothetical protein